MHKKRRKTVKECTAGDGQSALLGKFKSLLFFMRVKFPKNIISILWKTMKSGSEIKMNMKDICGSAPPTSSLDNAQGRNTRRSKLTFIVNS